MHEEQFPPFDAESQQSVSFIPLGGLGEIGMNCFALVSEDSILVVDCGATFPDDDLGEDLIVPDFSWLVENQRKLVGIFITHGHEDHIGAVPYLLDRLDRDCPVYAPPHAAALIAARLAEHELDDDCLCVVHPDEVYEVGPFLVEPIRVAHSIVDATALCIDTPVGRILHTADFDLDDEQPAGWLTDEVRLRELGNAGIALLLSDSTNIESPSRGQSEGDIGRELQQVVAGCAGRVVVGMFASNAHRLKALGEAARATGRKVCLLGRSLSRHHDVATRLGYLNYPSDLLVAPEQVAALPRHEVLILAGGSQAEAPSALRRLSQGSHPLLQLDAGDSVLLSSRVIPGNEKSVFTMTNDFMRLGVEVVTRREKPGIHTSGHASRAELQTMMEWTRPRAFVPVHGTLMHMRKHAQLAHEMGVDTTLVVENGSIVRLNEAGQLRVAGRVPSGLTRIAYGGEELDSRTRRRRFELARHGVVFVSFALDYREQMLGHANITALGVPSIDGDEDATNVLLSTVRRVVVQNKGRRMASLEHTVLRAVKSAVFEMSGVRPRVEVHVARVDA